MVASPSTASHRPGAAHIVLRTGSICHVASQPMPTRSPQGELHAPALAASGALILAAAAQINMHVFSPSRSFDEGADHVQWKSWAAPGRQ